jgi:hypothetical protein
MVPALVVLLSLALDGGASPCQGCSTWPDAQAAFKQVLEADPWILAIGEYHEVLGAPKVPSALLRFSRRLLPLLKGRLRSLVAETWMRTGRCGEVEARAQRSIEKTTRRPASTEDELTTMLGRAYELGAKNHTLLLDCAEYASLLEPDSGALDPEATLLLVKRKVEEKALQVREAGEGGVPGKLLVLYGGALHNDLAPLPQWAPYSFGPALAREVPGHYVELDLLVPEYVEDDEDLRAEPWFPAALRLAKAGKTVLINPRAGQYLLLFPASRR